MRFQEYVQPFQQLPILEQRVLHVLESLPDEVIHDFVSDHKFNVQLDNFEPGKGRSLIMELPDPSGAASRCVVLKPRLNDCNEAFAHYVIAHEFAHAFLRNGGWNEITDREEAADALAAAWGFNRPRTGINWFGR